MQRMLLFEDAPGRTEHFRAHDRKLLDVLLHVSRHVLRNLLQTGDSLDHPVKVRSRLAYFSKACSNKSWKTPNLAISTVEEQVPPPLNFGVRLLG